MKNKIALLIILTIISIESNAEYTIKYKIEPDSINFISWTDTTPEIIEWRSVGLPFNCEAFSPSPNTITINQSFEQMRNCSINEERITQNRKISDKGVYKNEGEPIVELRVSNVVEYNNAIGTRDCRYNINNYNWIYSVALETSIYWDGVMIYYSSYDHPSNYYPSVNVNGFNYERNYIPTEITGIYHGVCRTPL